ncbi:hypothetical protein AHAS_Ahas06G0200800 [Arachis hypogaea]
MVLSDALCIASLGEAHSTDFLALPQSNGGGCHGYPRSPSSTQGRMSATAVLLRQKVVPLKHESTDQRKKTTPPVSLLVSRSQKTKIPFSEQPPPTSHHKLITQPVKEVAEPFSSLRVPSSPVERSARPSSIVRLLLAVGRRSASSSWRTVVKDCWVFELFVSLRARFLFELSLALFVRAHFPVRALSHSLCPSSLPFSVAVTSFLPCCRWIGPSTVFHVPTELKMMISERSSVVNNDLWKKKFEEEFGEAGSIVKFFKDYFALHWESKKRSMQLTQAPATLPPKTPLHLPSPLPKTPLLSSLQHHRRRHRRRQTPLHPSSLHLCLDLRLPSAVSRIMAEDLVLDTAIRDWVLIPLSVVMVLIGVLRYFVSKLMRSSQTPDVKIVKEGQMMLRARNLRAGANFIPAKAFRARKIYFCNEENGLLFVPKGQAQNPQAQMFSDPNMAMDMMKKNLSMIIPQTLTFAWVNFFFSGFVAAKIPFPLTQRFRSMLQNGIDLSTVDVSYVSSRSWYFLNLFGLRGLFSLILGEENAVDDTQRMMQMGGFGMDPSKGLSAEKDNLDITQHDWALPNFEQRAEAVLRKVIN